MRATVSAAVLVLSVAVSAAARAGDTAAAARQLSSFIDRDTCLVIHVDLASFNLDPIQKWLSDYRESHRAEAGAVDSDAKSLSDIIDRAASWLADLRKTGAKNLFLVAAALDGQSCYLVVPLADGADNAVVTKVLEQGFVAGLIIGRCERMKDSIVMGNDEMLRKARAAVGDRPEMPEAIESLRGTDAQAALIVSAQMREALQNVAQKLPDEDGKPLNQLSTGLNWLALGYRASPSPSVTLLAQMTDRTTAKSLADNAIATIERFRQRPALARMAGALKPRVDGDRLVISLDQRQLAMAFADLAVPAALRARFKASQATSMDHMKAILRACAAYGFLHNGQWPDSLDRLVSDKLIADPGILRAPRQPGREQAYVYLKPAGKPGPLTMVLYEAYDRWPGEVAVGFGDGHVEVIASEAGFRRLLQRRGGR